MVLDKLFDNFADQKDNFSSSKLRTLNEEEDALNFKKRKGIQLPDIDLNLQEGDSEPFEENDSTTEEKNKEETNNNTSDGDGGGVGFDLPKFDLPEFSGIDLNAPDIGLEGIKAPNIKIDTDPIASAFVETAQKVADTTKELTEPLLNKVGKTIDESASAAEQAAANPDTDTTTTDSGGA